MKISLKVFNELNVSYKLNRFRFVVSRFECPIKLFLTGVCCTGLLFSCHNLDAQPFKKLVWSDEFNKPGLPDSNHWNYDLGTGSNGWGNNELQYYTNRNIENARIENGHLIIETKKEMVSGSQYTSARINTKNKGSWKYGLVEVKAKIPIGRGLWPAIWMMPSNAVYGGWPKSGEIDIMENVGFKPDTIFGTIHTQLYNGMLRTQKGKGISRDNFADSFHIYAVDWNEERIKFLIDNVVFYEFKNEKKGSAAWPFDQEFYLILNIAVGGNWGGQKGVDETVFPAAMLVDYVRVYQ